MYIIAASFRRFLLGRFRGKISGRTLNEALMACILASCFATATLGGNQDCDAELGSARYQSATRKYTFEILPNTAGESRIRGSRGRLAASSLNDKDRILWEADLVNAQKPLGAIVTDDGTFVVTVGDLSMLHGRCAVAIYDGRGEVVTALSVNQCAALGTISHQGFTVVKSRENTIDPDRVVAVAFSDSQQTLGVRFLGGIKVVLDLTTGAPVSGKYDKLAATEANSAINNLRLDVESTIDELIDSEDVGDQYSGLILIGQESMRHKLSRIEKMRTAVKESNTKPRITGNEELVERVIKHLKK
ncbi:MAG: hypothetical protein NT069_31495 [Planctomycetota bacterium]|nr:hypothetical protein [Planctomycetota bacterium]